MNRRAILLGATASFATLVLPAAAPTFPYGGIDLSRTPDQTAVSVIRLRECGRVERVMVAARGE